MTERPPHHQSGPDHPSALPPELAEFLKDQQYAALLHATDRGIVLVVKAPRRDIRSVQGRVPIELRHELYSHPAAPVVRMLTRIYDQPDRPLALESFVSATRSAETDPWRSGDGGDSSKEVSHNSASDAGRDSPPTGASGTATPPRAGVTSQFVKRGAKADQRSSTVGIPAEQAAMARRRTHVRTVVSFNRPTRAYGPAQNGMVEGRGI